MLLLQKCTWNSQDFKTDLFLVLFGGSKRPANLLAAAPPACTASVAAAARLTSRRHLSWSLPWSHLWFCPQCNLSSLRTPWTLLVGCTLAWRLGATAWPLLAHTQSSHNPGNPPPPPAVYLRELKAHVHTETRTGILPAAEFIKAKNHPNNNDNLMREVGSTHTMEYSAIKGAHII